MRDGEKAIEQFEYAAYLAGGLYRARILASAELAIRNGDHWQEVLDALVRNRPEWFDRAEGERRRRKTRFPKSEYQNVG